MSHTSHWNYATEIPAVTIGLDVGDRTSRVYEVSAAGERLREASVATRPPALAKYFGQRSPCRVVLEVGTHSPWLARALTELGHEVVVANPSAVYGKGRRRKRNDRLDAEFLARQGRADVKLLHPIQHRSAAAQADLALLRARDQLVQTRTGLINHVRGEAFPRRVHPEVPEALRLALTPLLEVIAALSRQIAGYDRQLAAAIRDRHPVAERLQQPAGVGPLTALAFVLLVEDPHRFHKSRHVGAYFGLAPCLDDSSDSTPQLRISKAGDELGRRLLVSAAQYILGPFGPPCDLRRYGEAIAQRGGKNAKKRAVVAVARKLAVLLHRLWVSETAYDPEYLARGRAA
jgi:transposase